MDFFETVSRRRSVRSYSAEPVPEAVIEKAVDAALQAPNSSNLQTCRIYWVRQRERKESLVEACLNQPAARTARELIVVTADPAAWKTGADFILKSFGPSAPKAVRVYYGRLIPFLYGWRVLNPLKWVLFNVGGLFRPLIRTPVSHRDVQEICVKSAALACENFMLAIAAQGFDTCPMEGFDACRVRRILGVSRGEQIVMVIAVGRRDETVPLFERYQLPRERVFSKI